MTTKRADDLKVGDRIRYIPVSLVHGHQSIEATVVFNYRPYRGFVEFYLSSPWFDEVVHVRFAEDQQVQMDER